MNSKKLGVYILISVLIVTMAIGLFACSGVSLSTKHTIIFNVQYGDELSVYTSIRSSGNEILKFPNDPTSSEKVFAGWYSDQLYAREVHEYDYENVEITEDINLYAKFVAASTITNPYTVTFETNKGTAVAAQELNFGEKVDVTKMSTSRVGFEFIGWFKDESLTKPFRAEYDRIWKSITVYAGWESTGYILTYELNGGVNSSQNPTKYKFEEPLALTDPTRMGYNFLGWYLDEDFSVAYDNTCLYEDNLTLYAKWSAPIQYTLDVDLDGGAIKGGATIPNTYTVEDTPFVLPEVEKDGYDFLGWFKDKDNGELLDTSAKYAENLSIAPYLKEKTFAITYVLNGGVNNSQNPQYSRYFSREVTLLDAAKKGYNFLGWYKESTFETQIVNPVTVDEPTTFYAKWSAPIQYTITAHLDDGSIESGTMPTTYNVTHNPLNLPSAVKSGFVFAGWYLDSGFSEEFNSQNVYAQDLDLYARYVDSELLLPENYIAMSSAQAMYVQVAPLQTEHKNLCIPIDRGVDSVKYNGTELIETSDEYVCDDHQKLIINNSVFSDFTLGVKNIIEVTYSDSSKKIYYLTLSDSSMYVLTTSAYYKGVSTAIEIIFDQTILSSNIYGVMLDSKSVDYSISGTKLSISSAIANNLSLGKHLVEIATNLGQASIDITIHNESAYVPYNVRADIDSNPGYTYIYWDSDFDATKYVVQIGSMTYASDSSTYASKFDGTRFDATGLLQTPSQTFKVIAYNGVDSYESSTLTFKYNLTSSETNKYLTNNLYVYGKRFNRFITSWEELYDLMFYIAIHSDELDPYNTSDKALYKSIYFCVDFDIDKAEQIDLTYTSYVNSSNPIASYSLDNTAFLIALLKEVSYLMPEASSFNIVAAKTNEGILPSQTYHVGFKFSSVLESTINRTKENTNNSSYKDCEYYPQMYGNGLLDSYVFPIDTVNNGTASVKSSVELYLALEHGYKPYVNATKYPELAALYENIKSVLRGILDEDMNEYQQALAIYQWLCTCVLYDHAGLTEASTLYSNAAKSGATQEEIDAYNASYGWSMYYMEGVFNNRLAVCNGIAAAYSAMCGIMGIPCHKLTGEAINSSNSKEMHAWNEIYIGGSWYVVDATWGSVTVSISGSSQKYETLTYDYFLMTTNDASAVYKHYAKATVYGKKYGEDKCINPYKFMNYKYDSTNYTLEVTNYNDLVRVLNYAVGNNSGTSVPRNIASGEVIMIDVYCPNNNMTSLASKLDISLYYNVYYLLDSEGTNSPTVIFIRK